MIRRTLIFGILTLFFIPFTLSAQDVFLKETVPADSSEDIFGPGRRHYVHPFVSTGVAFGPPENDEAAIKFWGSGLFDIGVRYKLKILKRWEMGIGVKYALETFRIEQDSGKKIFGPVQHEKEKLILNDLSGTYYNRFVFGKRGDFVGTFLDLGVYGDLSLGKKQLTVDELQDPSSSGFEEIKSKRKGLTFVKDLHYGALARLGYNRWVLFARYRLSDLFKNGGISGEYPELPRFRAGVQIGLHR